LLIKGANLKNWIIKVFNENGDLIKKEVVENSSKFAVKKAAKFMVNNTDDAESYIIIEAR
jgi:hypothetical protein